MNAQKAPQPDRAEERRQQIMQAALTCFARKGYHQTTMDDIVAESGLSKGTLYWYFKSKDDLFISLVKSFFLDMGREFDAIFEQHTSASDKLRTVAQGFVNYFQKTEEFFYVFFEFWMRSALKEELNQLFSTVLTQYQEAIAHIIAEGITRGEFKAVDVNDLALAVLAAYDGLMFYAMLMPGKVNIEQSSQVFTETFLDGLMIKGQKEEK